jgi:hypothetical protein
MRLLLGVVKFFANRFRALDAAVFQISVQDVLEIEPDGSPEPDVAIVRFRADYYGTSHPNGGDALLVMEVGDTERNPREKIRDYMRDGRIPYAWRIDIPNRYVELWEPSNVEQPIEVLHGSDEFGFEGGCHVHRRRHVCDFGPMNAVPESIRFRSRRTQAALSSVERARL